MKTCKKCNKEKPLTEEHFRKHSQGGWWYGSCKECERAYTRQYCNTNKTWKRPQVRAYQKKYKERNKDKIRDSIYRNRLGITLAEVKAMVERQGGGCAICENSIDWEDKHSFNVDHCHSEGRIRGILCAKCNRGIGHFDDKKELLTRAIDYLTL